MKIVKATASFGKLQNETLKFHEGLNIINAPNESGKSTWCAFIRAMLYGIDSSERARKGTLPDKLRYAPWSGAPMEGSMDLVSNGCDITISRSSRAKNAPMREFTAVYTGTNTKVEGLTTGNAGEQLTGVSKDVFNRSAYIPQGEVAVSGSPELEKRISSIVATGEEGSSYTESDERLRSWQRRRRYNQRGYLPELEVKIEDTERALDEMSGALSTLEQMESQLLSARQDCLNLEIAVTESRKRQRKDSLSRLNSGRNELKERSAEHDRAMAELSEKREELRSSRFGDRTAEELEEEVQSDVAELKALEKPSKSFFVMLPAILCFILAIVFAAVYTTKANVVFVILAGVFCVAAVILLLRFAKMKQGDMNNKEQTRLILKKYRATEIKDIYSVLELHTRLCAAVEEAEQREYETREAYALCHDKQADLETEALTQLDFAGGNSEAARLSRELAAARTKAEEISSQIAGLKGRLSAMGDPLVLSSELSCMKEVYEQVEGEYSAISLAIETLAEADKEMQTRFSPEIGKLAAKYMSAVTGGKYEDVLINRDFSASTRTDEDIVARGSQYLSSGTYDLLYLAVRLAVCELALPKGETCPLIIDDALVNFDRERYDQAIELLRRIAAKRQVILFTCRD